MRRRRINQRPRRQRNDLTASSAGGSSARRVDAAKPHVKTFVPWPPGAAKTRSDVLVAQRIQEKFGVNTVVEIVPAGAGIIGTNAVIQANLTAYAARERLQHRDDADGSESATFVPPGLDLDDHRPDRDARVSAYQGLAPAERHLPS